MPPSDAPTTAAVIFDMDGVLLDSEPLHYQAVRDILAEHGIDFPLAEYHQYLGTTLVSTWDDLSQRHAVPIPFEQFQTRYNADVLAHYIAGAPLIRGARELARQLRDHGVPTAVASSSHREWVDAALTGAELDQSFSHTVAGDEVAHGKPAPDIYLRAAQLLNVDPADCIAIEDAPAGLQSAQAAGMRTVLVRSDLTADLNLEADWRVDDLTQFQLDWLRQPAAAITASATASGAA